MPSLAAPAGATPSLLSLLTPVAAAPATPVDGALGPSFADIVAGLTLPPELSPIPLPPGQTLPVERPEIAGQAPDPVHDIDPLLTGCGWSPEPLLDQPAVPVLTLPPMAKPIARLDVQAEPDLMALPVQDAASSVGPERVLQAPARENVRLPFRVAALAGAAKALIADAVSAVADQPLTAAPTEETRASDPRPQAEPQPIVQIVNAEPQPTPALALNALPSEPTVAIVPEPEVAPATVGAAAPVALPRVVRPDAPVEAPAGASAMPQQASADPQPDAQPQPQPQPKPTFTPAAPADMRIAPELARQVAQMIRPALGSDVGPQPAATIPVDAIVPTAAPTAPQPVVAAAPVQPASFQSAPVDLGRAGWVETMIERIAEMPQVDRREAQIKLLPDMLGKVDVTLVERDDRVHVTLNADTVQARQLLSEAAPRLQELAEARGLRLAQPEIGGGTSQDRRGHQDQNQPQTPLRPRSAQPDQADDPSTSKGDRIA